MLEMRIFNGINIFILTEFFLQKFLHSFISFSYIGDHGPQQIQIINYMLNAITSWGK